MLAASTPCRGAVTWRARTTSSTAISSWSPSTTDSALWDSSAQTTSWLPATTA
ncbi:hypothetical protein JYU34_020730 [Plutella xylostella]|uniref:Uncharacterized protein n=1 Tax=Plutella xylostella TaxID=51655 RepID=A0ABQ7PWH8_PLUXY|nr:hypothetical protein JYU34_020730 [Plutella xylostella]